MTPERYFFIYAFPCAYLKLERGDLTKKEYELLEKKFLNKDSPDRRELERVFSPAFVWIKRISERLNKDIWDFNVIYEYWNKEHNEIINNGEGKYSEYPEVLKDLCRIHEAEIVRKQEDKNILLVKYNRKQRAVFSHLVPNAKIGDKVKIHYAYAVEEVE